MGATKQELRGFVMEYLTEEDHKEQDPENKTL